MSERWTWERAGALYLIFDRTRQVGGTREPEDARFICAAVNACAGIEVSMLEGFRAEVQSIVRARREGKA